ncbi:hypothetical protein BCI9360_00102 [Bacillus sp. CECT 9360]|nr:hypothetical protein BCI9360_00102 [Bacillus sp. CECT 9360]
MVIRIFPVIEGGRICPLFVPVFGEWNGFDGVASLMFFYFILLLGGIITLIASLFMPKESMNNNEQL